MRRYQTTYERPLCIELENGESYQLSPFYILSRRDSLAYTTQAFAASVKPRRSQPSPRDARTD